MPTQQYGGRFVDRTVRTIADSKSISESGPAPTPRAQTSGTTKPKSKLKPLGQK